MKNLIIILSFLPLATLGQRKILDYSLGEYMGAGRSSDSLGVVFTDATGLMCNGGTGTPGTASLIGTSTKMKVSVNSLHCAAWLDYNGHPWFGGQQSGIPYITGNNVYDGIQDSAGSSSHFFDMMTAGWNFQDGEEGFFVARDGLDSSIWICGDLKNGIRGNGTASTDLMKWVKVQLPAGLKAIQIYSSFTVFVLCDTVAGGIVLGQRIYTWSVSGAHQASLGYGSPSFGESAGTYNGGYNTPQEILVNGQHAHNIRMMAGGLECNYALFDSAGVQRVYGWGTYGWRMCHSTSVGADPLNNPTDITSKILTSTVTAIGPIDTIVTDMASTHMLVGSGSTRVLVGWGSSEQGTLGNGAQLNFAAYSSPYNDGGSDESAGQIVQFTPVVICAGKTNWKTLLNGGYYCYYNIYQDQNGDWWFCGRYKIFVAPMGVHYADYASSNLSAVQPDGAQFPYFTKAYDAFANTCAPSTSQGCSNACVGGPVSSTQCSAITVTCYSIHAALSASWSGSTGFLTAAASTYGGTRLQHVRFSFVSGPSTPNMGVVDNPVNKTDTITGLVPGTYVVKVLTQGQYWEADSTTTSFTVTSTTQAGFYISSSGSGTACTNPAPCPASYIPSLSLTAGDSVYFQAGGTYAIQLAPVSGVYYTSYGTGNLPIIGGMVALTGWTSIGGNVWQTTYAGPQPNLLAVNGVLQSKSTSAGFGQYWAMTQINTTSFTDAAHASILQVGDTLIVKSSAYTLDKVTITGISGSTITVSPALTYNGAGAAGYFKQSGLPGIQNQWRNTAGTVQIFSTTTPTGVTVPAVDTPVYSAAVNFTLDHLHIQGGNYANVILAFQAASGVTLSNDTLDYGFDGVQLRSEGGVTILNTKILHMTDNGILKQNANNYNNSYLYDTLFDIGMQPGMGHTGNASQYYCGIIAGDSGSVVKKCFLDSIGYIAIANYGSGFDDDSSYIRNWCQILEDGAAHYTWIGTGGNTAFARRRKVKNLICIGGGSSISHNGVSLNYSSAACGIYNDNISDSVDVTNCVVGNVNSICYFDHGPYNTFTGNIGYGEGWTQFLAAATSATPIVGLVVENNVFASQFGALQLTSPNNDLGNFGAIDYNSYLGPVNTLTNLFYTKSSVDAGTTRSFPGFKSSTSYDSHSTLQNGPQVLLYNPTAAPISMSLGYAYYLDVTGAPHTGSVTIPAYSGMILQLYSPTYLTVPAGKKPVLQ
ncbi:MAG TPA: hypothetical protein VFE32_17475 [Puia sp.]|jgi:hypothetical protein|nr:hypothetical protein [Puia sp.]